MAIIKKNELKQMDEKSLNNKLKELRDEIIRIRAQIAMGSLPENPGRIKEIKRTIARIITLKRIKEGNRKV